MPGGFVVSLLMGAVVGVVLALTGSGGGILAVPLLVFGLHMSIVQAVPVGLIAVGLASAVGAVLGLREGQVRYRVVAAGAAAALLAGRRLGTRFAGARLQQAFGLTAATVSAMLLLRGLGVLHL